MAPKSAAEAKKPKVESPFGVDIDELSSWVTDKDEGIRKYRLTAGSPSALAVLLKTDVINGRNDTADLEAKRTEIFGVNKLPEADDVTFLELVIDALSDKMMLMLIASAVVSLVLGLTVPDPHTGEIESHGWVEGAAILVSVAIVTLVTSINNYQKEQKFKELSQAAPPTQVKVTRGGKEQTVLDSELHVGDVIHLVGGMIVPVDGVLIKGMGFKMDESTTTGENDEMEKDATNDPIFRSGTNVNEGEGTILAIAVGVNSLAGRIAMGVRGEKEDTPLQVKLDELADKIGRMGMVAATLMFICLTIKELYPVLVLKTGTLHIKKFLEFLTTSITIVVVAVPEGLPLSVTIALAYSVRQMMHENNLVRVLAACETMGSATTICTDKTGTLTQNEMTVVRGYVARRSFELIGSKKVDEETIKKKVEPHAGASLLARIGEGISLNSTAFRAPTGGKYIGNKTEQAMLLFVERLGIDPMAERKKVATDDLQMYPFTSARKSMTTCVRLPEGKGIRYHVKGASEIILESCAKYHNGKEEIPMTDALRADITAAIYEFAKNRLRTIAIASSDAVGRRDFDEKDAIPPPLTFLGLLGIEDPIRPEVEGAVERCKNAGVMVRMVTGDNKTTAISIAKKAGIYGTVYAGRAKGENGLAMEGKDFRMFAKSEAKLNIILPRLQVLARASPMDKQILVESLMNRGEVVAVTGDGTNDAPALRKANVGFAMNTGTDVAKKASDVVILDDNFRSIVTAMKWGRNVNDNILKFIQFQTTVNVAAVFIAFTGAVMSAGGESPLKPVHLLWLNLIMDTMAALALATEPPTDALLDRPPRSKEAPLITRRCWVNILGQATYQIAVQLWLLNGGHKWFKVKKDSIEHCTIVFNVFVLMQVFNEFNARHLGQEINVFAGLLKARLFMAIIVVTLVVQYLGITYAGAIFKACPLSRKLWTKCFTVSAMPLLIGVVLRLIPISEPFVPIGHDVEDPESAAEEAARPKLTFKEAAERVIAQLKVAGALSSAVSGEGGSSKKHSAE